MALFKRKQNTDLPAPAGAKAGGQTGEKKPAISVSKPAPVSGGAIVNGLAHILRKPRITEKATTYMEVGTYVFNVAPRSTKQDIEKAVFAVYKVKPRMVRVVTVPSKTKRSSRTGKTGVKHGGKKAYVYLKKGETITITQ